MASPNVNNFFCRCYPFFNLSMYDVAFLDDGFWLTLTSYEQYSLSSLVMAPPMISPSSWNYMCVVQHLCILKLHVSNTWRGEPQYGFVACLLRFHFLLLFTESLLQFYIFGLSFESIYFSMYNSNVFVWVWSFCFKSIGWVKGTITIFDVGSSYVLSVFQTILKTLKSRFLVCVTQNTHKPWFESIQIEENMKFFCIYDSNKKIHLIQIMQHYDSNHKLHVIHVSPYPIWFESPLTHESNHTVSHIFSLDIVQFDLNHSFYITRIITFRDSNHIYILTRITRKMGYILYVDIVSFYLLTWLKSPSSLKLNQIIFFMLFLCFISSTYKSLFSLQIKMIFHKNFWSQSEVRIVTTSILSDFSKQFF